MKVGILTFHYAMNYGAVLQAYGLQNTIEQMGHNVHMVNYRPEDTFSLFREIKRYAFKIRSRLRREKHTGGLSHSEFSEFVESRLHVTESVLKEQLREFTEDYDALIVGSDQVWNAHFWGRFEGAFFLNFCESPTIKKISYAACFGQPDQPHAALRQLPAFLNNLNHISVRNETSMDIVKEYTKQKVQLVVDPTLLCSYDDMIIERDSPEEYIFVYCLSLHLAKEIKAIADALSDRRGKRYRVVSIFSADSFPYADEYVSRGGPCDFVSLISQASYVICSSFHGMIFAIKYRKPFIVVHLSSRGMRITDFLERYGARNRLVSSAEEALSLVDSEIDFERLHRLIRDDVKHSRDFLNKALS